MCELHKAAKKRSFRLYGKACVYCGSKENLTVDHLLPRSKFGSSHDINVVPACSQCNLRKGNLLPGAEYQISEELRLRIVSVQETLRQALSVTQAHRQKMGFRRLLWWDASAGKISQE